MAPLIHADQMNKHAYTTPLVCHYEHIFYAQHYFQSAPDSLENSRYRVATCVLWPSEITGLETL
jgi:hypothetical protein